jgi:hypothetical protein
MAIGFPLFSLHVGKRPNQQYSRRKVEYAPGLAADPSIPHPTWQPPAQASSRPFAGRMTQPSLRDAVKYGNLGRIVNRDLPKGYR